MENDHDNISKFGKTFQSKCLGILVSDRTFLERILDILSPDYFETNAHHWMVKVIMDYFPKYKNIPTKEVFKIEILKIDDPVTRAAVLEVVKEAYNHVSAPDSAYVKEQFLEFCKNQKLKSAICDSVDLLKLGDYDGIGKIIRDATQAGIERDLGHDYFNEFDARMSESAREVVKTNWDLIDGHLDGGLGKGELGFIVAPAGSGKCIFSTTKITIQYEEIGIPSTVKHGKKYKVWISPFEHHDRWQKENSRKKAYKRTVTEEIKIGDLFNILKIEDKENTAKSLDFSLRVKTPYGYKPIVTAFRTEKQITVTTYFTNNMTLITSEHHLVRANCEWKKIKDLVEDDIIETEKGTTAFVKQDIGEEAILYDISVEDVHCYYSNGIVSHNSWFLAHLGAEALRQGKNVMHFTMELGEKYVGRRYDAIFSKISFQDVCKFKDQVKKSLDSLNPRGQLFLKYFPMNIPTATTLKSYVERLQLLTGIRIDLMVVDYADLLRPSVTRKNSNSYEDGGAVYGELRSISGELQCSCWSASQGNRCFSLQTTVNEQVRGIIQVKDLQVNDKILTHKGYRQVSYIFPINKQPVYKIKLKSGKFIECSANHRFPTQYNKIKSISSGLSVGDKLFVKK